MSEAYLFAQKDNLQIMSEDEIERYIDSITEFAEINALQKYIFKLADRNRSVDSKTLQMINSKFWSLLI